MKKKKDCGLSDDFLLCIIAVLTQLYNLVKKKKKERRDEAFILHAGLKAVAIYIFHYFLNSLKWNLTLKREN